MLMPAFVLGTALAAVLMRQIRNSMIEVLSADYIRTARAKGLPGRAVVFRHAIRNGLIPVVTILGLQMGALIDRKSTRLNSSHSQISYAVFCLKKKKTRKSKYALLCNYTTMYR